MDREPPDNERAVKAVRRTLDEVRRASDIVGRMRAMVTKEAATRTVFDLNEAVREVLALTEGERVRLGITLRRTLQPCLVTGDRVQFQQVIMNLVVNAIDAMREVPVKERRLIILCEALDDGSVQITVEDRGPGVPPEQSERIFEHLFTTKTGGTGLGLPISKSIVEAHGGRLWLENAEPRGSAFKVRLPQAGADA
jgi:signal transduction histidine kinase